MNAINVIWFRYDLRLTDHPALRAGSDKTCALVFTADGVGLDRMGAASRVYLHHALTALQKDLEDRYQAPLLLFPTIREALATLQKKARIEQVLWNRSYEPRLMERDLLLEEELKAAGIKVAISPGNVLFEPWEIKNKTGKPFKVFTPFYKTLLKHGTPTAPLTRPRKITTLDLAHRVDFKLLPKKPRWDTPMMADWNTDEAAIWAQWKGFKKSVAPHYVKTHDLPGELGTSRLAAALHFGQISVRSIWADADSQAGPGMTAYLRQLVWRDFAIYSLYHQPTMDHKPIVPAFQRFPWVDEPEHLRAWQRGMTGYPIVDAGMRELYATGFMHNRVRMIVGSFLVKNLHINWLEGAAWFWDTLIDADLANNSMGWQWVAGCGIDPSPYFRIFNPRLQSEKFDPDGTYIKRWVPELAGVAKRHIHAPWEAHTRLNYPKPLVDFAESRQLALMFYDRIKAARNP